MLAMGGLVTLSILVPRHHENDPGTGFAGGDRR